MELLKTFGINQYLLIAQIINFLVIFFVLQKYAYKPIMKMLHHRKHTIEEAENNAKKAQEALDNAVEQEKTILKHAQTEAKKIVTDANKQATDIVNKATEQGKKQVVRMLADANDKIERDRKDMEKRLASHITTLAIEVLERSLKGLFTDKEQQEVIFRAKQVLKQ